MDKILQSGTCGGASEHYNGNVCAYVHSVDENEKKRHECRVLSVFFEM